jgi:hypothetical protein
LCLPLWPLILARSVHSVNSLINADDFPTVWGTFASTTELILSLPPGCWAATFDISAAYQITPVHSSQQNYTCIYWKGLVRVDRTACFGLPSSAGVFGSIADMLVAIYRASGICALTKWVDDFFVIIFPTETWTKEDFMAITSHLGVPWSLEKLCHFSTVQHFTGFDWDLDNHTVSLPQEKLTGAIALVHAWGAPAAHFSSREAASLHGKLVHISSIFCCIHPFLHSISYFASSFSSPHGHIAKRAPGPNMQANLSWICFILKLSPNRLPLCPSTPIDLAWWDNASSSFGIGVVVGGHWAVWKYAPDFWVGPNQEYNIGWAKAIAVKLALRIAFHHHIISHSSHAGCTFLVHSDNQGVARVVAIVNKGQSHSWNTNQILKEIYKLLAQNQISLCTEYVTSHKNVTDALSQGDIPDFLYGFPSATVRSHIPLPGHLVGKLISV